MVANPYLQTQIQPGFVPDQFAFAHYPADSFPTIHPIHWLHSHFAVGGWSPLQRISGMLTAHMTRIAPENGFTWHPHRGLEIFTWVLEGELYHEDTTGGKGVIGAGELQRMFAGNYIEHQELNLTLEPARVIQIWFVADPKFRGLEPHYQQLGKGELPSHANGDAVIYHLIGDDSPMLQHMTGRLTAAKVSAGGKTQIEAPLEGEDLFVYVTDGEGQAVYEGEAYHLGQYDVILTSPKQDIVEISADGNDSLHFMSFYLPSFLRNGH